DAQVEVTTSSLPSASVGSAYSAQLTAAGGRPPYGWSVSAGGLPAGLNLSASSGAITGAPAAAGVFVFTATVTDADSRVASKPLSISVAPPALATDGDSRVQVTRGQPFSLQLQAHGGAPPYVWSVDSGVLPSGLGLSSDGLISGTASADSVSETIVAKVRDQSSQAATLGIEFEVRDAGDVPVI